MKKNKFDILGIIVGFTLMVGGSCIKYFTSVYYGIIISAVIIMIGAIMASIFIVKLCNENMMKSKNGNEYRREVYDERNVMIKDKSGYATNCVTLVLLSIASIIFIMLDYILPAIIIGIIIASQPIITIFIAKNIEKHF